MPRKIAAAWLCLGIQLISCCKFQSPNRINIGSTCVEELSLTTILGSCILHFKEISGAVFEKRLEKFWRTHHANDTDKNATL